MGEWALPAIAVLLIAYGAVSARLRSTVVTQAMVFVAAGLLIGNRSLEIVDADAAHQFVRHLAEVTLGLVLFTDAVRINVHRLRRELQVPVRLLGIGLPLTIVAGTAAGLALFPALDVWTAAALATILAPTDAALGLPVVNNRRLPSRIRQGLNVESGLNDGVCVPLLIIFLTVAEAEEGVAQVEPVRVILEEIGFGTVGGVLAGVAGAWALRTFAPKGLDGQELAADQRGGDTAARPTRWPAHSGAAGSSPPSSPGSSSLPSRVRPPSPRRALAEQSGELLNAATFMMFGAVLLGPAFAEVDWRIVLYAVLSLTVVRMVPVALAMLGLGMRMTTIGFLGWFGPRGLASIVFVLLLVERTELPERPLMLTVVTLTVALSVYAHGLTAWPGANRYAHWYAAHTADHPTSRKVPVADQRTRGSDADRATEEPREHGRTT